MDAYTYIDKSDENLRNAINRAYGKKCFYCGQKINMYQLEIDHIIPISDKDLPDSDDVEKYLSELIENKFIKNCIANYLPSCSHCNKQKNSKYFTVGNLRYFHEQALKHSNKVIIYMENFKYSEASHKKDEEFKKLLEEKELFKEKTIVETPYKCCYAYGLGEVRLDAFIPVSIRDELSCLLRFNQNGISDCMFSFDEDNIKTIFFNGYKTGINNMRNFIWYIYDKDIAIKLANNRFGSTYETANQLALLFDDLYEEFYKREASLLNTIGATYFEEIKRSEFSILKIPINIWEAMVDFAQDHDYYYGNTVWDIFQPLNLVEKNRITIYKNHNNPIEADVFAKLYVDDMNERIVTVIWQAGHTQFLRTMEGFDNERKWKVDYTHDWILNEFIPYIFYLNMPEINLVQRLYKKRISFDEFKLKFNYHDYGIQSLSFKE